MVYVGIGGATRNATAAVCTTDGLVAVCQQERLTRERGEGLVPGQLPGHAVTEVLRLAGRQAGEVEAYVVAEDVRLPSGLPVVQLEHHFAHAAASFFTSGFDRSAVVVCDHHSSPEVSVWCGEGDRLRRVDWPVSAGLARLYSACADFLLGDMPGREDALEALARIGRPASLPGLARAIRYCHGALQVESSWLTAFASDLEHVSRDGRLKRVADAASGIQRQFGELLVQFATDVRDRVGADRLCLAGGLFYNTYFNALLATSGTFRDVFVPVNPGNGGLAVGCALSIARQKHTGVHSSQRPGAFLGPGYEAEEIKAILDNCKLTYDFLANGDLITATVEALKRGLLVGWFQGRMEWGRRALGSRSILANPAAPFVLENLNRFLKKRPPYWAYGLAVCQEELATHFAGPSRAPFMEHDFAIRDIDAFRHALPGGVTSLRVQSVTDESPLFHELHRTASQSCRSGVTINTSFNGFHEPIVCSARDAIRVFFGSGLDILVIDRFIIRK